MVSKGSERLLSAHYPVVREVTTRISDMDGYGHLNGIRIGLFYEDARASFYSVAFEGIERPRFFVAQLTIQYLAEGHWPGTVQVGTGISRIGNSSFEMAQGLFMDGRCLGLCETILVYAPGQTSAPLHDEIRARLERMGTVKATE